ncbi:hypothetical protein E2C01_015081 [Portunus trituberculatus]|uniref:Uncharacterized protein n=1 Tax=Portunus trituberculatus TaxID=210409 RepID=A0A5B7DLM1_PORTR|nr:hypothetical protein [Portunus trituberculatus]
MPALFTGYVEVMRACDVDFDERGGMLLVDAGLMWCRRFLPPRASGLTRSMLFCPRVPNGPTTAFILCRSMCRVPDGEKGSVTTTFF